ncbi:hypothetical protein Ahy_A04g017314 [Arachis hypogaea]|uniref:F-box associated beta-propeller type 1 domain-containing protein n=1 Tax=Arachis hypogaea TaxID=3818 RepID=A0A445DAP7_ARAHY|nr:hypothetical protein Ahy_A04g017314 [Arachis hypogaea]
MHLFWLEILPASLRNLDIGDNVTLLLKYRTHSCVPLQKRLDGSLVFNGDNYQVKEVSFPFKKKQCSEFRVLGSCRGFLLLSRRAHFFVVWNPLTGFSKRISCSCIVHRSEQRYVKFPGDANLYGFGYDASRDNYLVVVAWLDGCGNYQHLDCLSLTTNSWINLDVALPKPLGSIGCRPRGLY